MVIRYHVISRVYGELGWLLGTLSLSLSLWWERMVIMH